MNRFLLFVWRMIALLTNCNHLQNNSSKRTDLLETVPEPDLAVRLNYEALRAL